MNLIKNAYEKSLMNARVINERVTNERVINGRDIKNASQRALMNQYRIIIH